MRRAPARRAAVVLVLALSLLGSRWPAGSSAADSGRLSLAVDVEKYAGPTPLRTAFSAEARNGIGAVRFRWCFDDGKQSDEQSPSHSFDRAGYYTVVVQARDETGARGREDVLLGVWPPWQWEAAQRKPITRQSAGRARRVQQERTDNRRKRIRRRGGLTLTKCTRAPLL